MKSCCAFGIQPIGLKRMHASPGRPQNHDFADFRVSNIQASVQRHHRFPALAQVTMHIRCKYTARGDKQGIQAARSMHETTTLQGDKY
jgi:hypothetical protein